MVYKSTFNLPDISDCFLQGGTPGTKHGAGLPPFSAIGNNNYNVQNGWSRTTFSTSQDPVVGSGTSRFKTYSYTFGDSTTVQPKSVETLFCIKF